MLKQPWVFHDPLPDLFFHVTPVTIFHDQSQMPVELLDCSAECVWRDSGPYGAPLKYDGQHDGFLLSDFSVVLGQPSLWAPGIPSSSALTGWVGQARYSELILSGK